MQYLRHSCTKKKKINKEKANVIYTKFKFN